MTAPAVLRLGPRVFEPHRRLIMAIVNRTPDSFFDRGATWTEDAAMQRVQTVVAAGAEIVDIGGVPAAPGSTVDVTEELRRTVPFVAAVRAAYPDVVISVDTWRHEVAREVCAAGADLINDSWGGWDDKLPEVAAEFGAALVCSHAGGLPPRTRPYRVAFADVVGGAHVKLRLAGGGGALLDAIAFRAVGTPLGEGLLAGRGRTIHAAGRLRLDDWNGRVRVQLEVEDAAPATA